jgi:hypothetical protein
MSSLSVSQNITKCEGEIKKLIEQLTLINQEITRLDGSLRVFKNLQELGIENIVIPNSKNIIDNTEVIDNSPD